MKTCPMCGGNGTQSISGGVQDSADDSHYHGIREMACNHCQGAGQIADDFQPPGTSAIEAASVVTFTTVAGAALGGPFGAAIGAAIGAALASKKPKPTE